MHTCSVICTFVCNLGALRMLSVFVGDEDIILINHVDVARCFGT